MKLTRRELRKGAAALGAAGAAPLVRHAEAQTTQKRELVIAQGGDISKFDPHVSTSSNDVRVSFNLFEWTPNPNQQVEIRRFNFRVRRA